MSTLQNSINANTITPLLLKQGGSQANLSASAGGIVWSNSTQMQIMAGTATAGLLLVSGASASPAWLATVNSAVLSTSSGGVASWSTTLPSGISATNLVLTTPRMVQINDSNGNEMLLFNATPSAVNYIQLDNNVTGSPVAILAQGSDANIGFTISSKGTGQVEFYSQALTNQVGFNLGSTLMAVTNFNMSSVTGTYTVTFPASSGTVSLLGNTTTGTGSTLVLATSPSLTTPNIGAATANSINFGGTTLANYLEGTFTPVFTSSGGGTATYSTQSGTYTQIGNRVYFEITLFLSALPSSGNVTITGLPVANGSSRVACPVYSAALQATVTSPLQGFITPTSSGIDLFSFSAGSSATTTVSQYTTSSQLIISGCYHV